MSSPSLVQSCLWTVTRWVSLVRSFCCTRRTHRVIVQRQDWTRLSELMCCAKGKKLQPCSILSLNNDTMGVPIAAETSYLYHSTWVHSALFNLVFEQWHDIEQGWVNSCAVIKVRSYCCTRGTHRVTAKRQDWTRLSELMWCDKGSRNFLHLSEHMSSLRLVQSCLWTVTRWVPLVQQKLLTFMCCDKGRTFLLH
jgi:hypothetical protein